MKKICKLKKVRLLMGISQWEVALKTGVWQSRISLAENGLTELSKDEKKRIAKALGVQPKKLFSDHKRRLVDG